MPLKPFDAIEAPDAEQQRARDALDKQEQARTQAAQLETTASKIEALLHDCSDQKEDYYYKREFHEDFTPSLAQLRADIALIAKHYSMRHPASNAEAVPDGVGWSDKLYYGFFRLFEARHDSHQLFALLIAKVDQHEHAASSVAAAGAGFGAGAGAVDSPLQAALKVCVALYDCCQAYGRTGRFYELTQALLVKYLKMSYRGYVFNSGVYQQLLNDFAQAGTTHPDTHFNTCLHAALSTSGLAGFRDTVAAAIASNKASGFDDFYGLCDAVLAHPSLALPCSSSRPTVV